MSLSKSIILILTLLTLVCSRVLVAPPGSSEEVGANTREAVMVEATMERLLKKHKNFLKKRIGCADSGGVQTNAHTELQSEPRALLNFKNELHFHMVPVGKREISDFKQKMQQKFPGSAASAFDFKIDKGTDIKSVLLFYSND